MSKLIEKDGERQYVTSLEGYEGWIEVPDVAEPKDYSELIDGQWVEKPELIPNAYIDMSRDELLAWIEILEARLDTVEDQINGGI